MNFKKMLTTLTTSAVLLGSVAGTGLTVFTEQAQAAQAIYEFSTDQTKKNLSLTVNRDAIIQNLIARGETIDESQNIDFLVDGASYVGQFMYLQSIGANAANRSVTTEYLASSVGMTFNLRVYYINKQGMAKSVFYPITYPNIAQVSPTPPTPPTPPTNDAYSIALNAVNQLFNNNTQGSALKATTDQAAINAAKALVDKVPNPSQRSELQEALNIAQQYFNIRIKQNAARKAVNELFNNNLPSSNTIKDTTNQVTIDDAQALINGVRAAASNAGLTMDTTIQTDLNKAQALLNSRNKQLAETTARKAVNELFSNNLPSSNTIKDTTNQVTIDAAQALINAVTDVSIKTGLQTDLNKAQSLLNNRNNQVAEEAARQSEADKAVNELFTNDKPSSDVIKPTTDQKSIDNAQSFVNAVTDSGKKANLQADLDKAQELLNAKLAEEKKQAEEEAARQAAADKAVNELFTNDKPSSDIINPTTDQKSIDNAQSFVNAVTDAGKKASLQADLDKAQELLNAKLADEKKKAEEAVRQSAADKAVNELFTNDKPSSDTIKGTTDQLAIDKAQGLIDTVTDTEKKASLQADLDKAQELLNAKLADEKKKAEEASRQATADKAVNELFTNDKPTSDAIKETTDQPGIDKAQGLIDAVTDVDKKASLQADLDKAQELLNAKLADEKKKAEEASRQAAADKAVNELFTNDKPTSDAIKGTTDQPGIDKAQDLIDAITDTDKKASLQADLDKAKGLLDAKLAEERKQSAAEKAINELFKDDKPLSNEIKETTDQNAINVAQLLINGVVDAEKKASLQADLDKAQELLNAKLAEEKKQEEEEAARQSAADKVVNELFANDKPSSDTIKGTTDQPAIDKAQGLIDTVTDTEKKASLQADLDKAKALLAEKLNSSLTLNDFQLKVDGYILGNVSSNIKSIRVTVNGAMYTGGTIKTDGTFTFYAKDKIKLGTDKVVVSTYNAAGELVSTKNLTIAQNAIGQGTVSPSEYKVGVDSNLVGTYTGDVSTVRVYVDGVEYKGGTLTKTDGTFKFYLKDKVKNVNQSVTIKGFDVNGNVLSTNAVTLTAQTPGVGEILPAPFVLGKDYYVTGTYKGDVRKIRVFVDGTEYSGGTINIDGTFKFYGRDKIKSKANVVKIIAYDANNNVTAEKIIPVVTPEPGVGEILPNAYNVDTDSSIKGSYTGDVVKMKLFVDDKEYSGGTFNPDKTFSFYARGKITSTTQNVKVKGYDAQGNAISEKQLVVTTK